MLDFSCSMSHCWPVCSDASGSKDQETSESVDGKVQSGGDDRVDVGPSVRQKSPPVQGLLVFELFMRGILSYLLARLQLYFLEKFFWTAFWRVKVLTC